MAKMKSSEAIKKLKALVDEQAKLIGQLKVNLDSHAKRLAEQDTEILLLKELFRQMTGREPQQNTEVPDDGETWDPSKGQRKMKKSGRVSTVKYDDTVYVRGREKPKKDRRAAKKDNR
jgi:hypothetical protein